MNDLVLLQDNICSETFTKCFISLENLSDNFSLRFICIVWNQPPEGIVNSHACWRFEFYADTPFKALEKAYIFVKTNIEKNYNINYDECLKLRNEINN